MNLTEFSIKRSRVALGILIVVIFAGIGSYQSMSRDSMPPYTVRVATIITSFPGAGPERIEELVTDKIEKVAQELPELKVIKSTSRSGLSIVSVELRMDVAPKDLQAVWDRLRRKISAISDLPSNVVPYVDDDGIGEVFGLAVGLTSDGYSYSEMKQYADDLRDELIILDDAAKVELNGAQEERIFIEFDNDRLRNYGLTSNKLYNLIGSTNILNSGGQINVEEQRFILEPTGNFDNVGDIKDMLIPIGQGNQVVALSDITNVKRGYMYPEKQLIRINGKDALSLHISLKDGANILKLGEEMDVILGEWQERLPVGLDVFRISSLDDYIEVKVDSFMDNLIQAVLIVLVVMLIFLGFRTGLIVSSLIPIVTITTILIMAMIGLGINQITLAALIMALGMMVDNGIVVAESVMVKVENGEDKIKAAIDSCSELIVPLLISTLTTSAAFLSFYLAESVMGDIVGPIFVVITIALLSSWLISMSIITLFCVYFLKVEKKEDKKEGILDRMINKLKSGYKNLILLALSWKKTMLFSIVVMFVLSIMGFGFIEIVFFPDSDRNLITVDINLPEGTNIETTKSVVLEIEQYIQDNLLVNDERPDGIVDWSAYIGEGPSSYDLGYSPDESNSNYAHILVNTTAFEANGKIIESLDDFCFFNFPDAEIKVSKLSGGGTGTPIEILVSGKDPDKLTKIAAEIKEKLFSIAYTKNIKDDWGPKGKKFIVEIDANRAQLAGITNQDIAISLQTVLDGFTAGEFREGDKNIPIVMLGKENQEQTLFSLETANIYAQNSGRSVPLSQVADIKAQWQYSKIKRVDLKRTINISSELKEGGNAAEITKEIEPWLLEQQGSWGRGYAFELGGDSKSSAENMGAVADYLPLSGFIIVMLLILQFNSVRKTLMIVCTIPLGIIGMVIGLILFQVPFGFMAFLGVISLAGIVINNAIVLIDRIEIEQSEMKRNNQDAVIGACLQRFRPIILSTLTTVCGLIPLYLGGGETWESMAVTIMVGLLFGTVITLLFIPAFYSVLYRVNYRDYKFNDELLD